MLSRRKSLKIYYYSDKRWKSSVVKFIICKVMKYWKILIKYNIYLKKLYLISENIKKVVFQMWKYKIQLFFTGEIEYPFFYVDFIDPTSDFQTSIIFLLVTQTECLPKLLFVKTLDAVMMFDNIMMFERLQAMPFCLRKIIFSWLSFLGESLVRIRYTTSICKNIDCTFFV